MHLLQALPGAVEDGSEPVDLGQTPADIVAISAADTELAALSEARTALGADAPSLRLASLAHLAHPMSVDLHIDACASRSRLVVARVLGGEGYWPYGLEQYAVRLAQAGVSFAALPGDDKPDEALWRASSGVSRADWEALWGYLVEGGPGNAVNFLRFGRAMISGGTRPEGPKPLLRAGVYWPGDGFADLSAARAAWTEGAPVVPLVFYRALAQGAGLNPVNRLVRALLREGVNPLPVFVASLKDPVSVATLHALFRQAPPDVILNATAFAAGAPGGGGSDNPLAAPAANGAQVLQVVFAGGTEDAWRDGLSGLSPRDIAMNVALPEVDGRVLTRAVSFKGEAYFDEATECRIAAYRSEGSRIAFVAQQAGAWARLRRRPAGERRVALVLANYPNKDGRLANGVGLDAPEAVIEALTLLGAAGYGVDGAPESSAALMEAILAGPTNWLADRAARSGGARLSLEAYRALYDAVPYEARRIIEERWGAPEADPFFDAEEGGFALSVLEFGHVVVGVQPARGYNIDPKATYHAPDLPPPHGYLAFYFWLRGRFGADAIVHMGKHGNLEWLPGKALALSERCFPEIALGPAPHIYPFIVNDPGEGAQAKRRASAVIVDHLTPPMTRAETYGPLKDLEALVDEYYEAAGLDPRRLDHLRREILSLSAATGVGADAGMDRAGDEAAAFAALDDYLCELKEAQIRDGLHVFGRAPDGRLRRDLALALVRAPRGAGEGGDASLLRALALDLGLDAVEIPSAAGAAQGFDPLDCRMAAPWAGARPDVLAEIADAPWRTAGDAVERLEMLSEALLDGAAPAPDWGRTRAVLDAVRARVLPAIDACGPSEGAGLLSALDGRFLAPGPSGAPTRGRLDVLPTGRNFYSVDTRAVPTPAAWALGWASATRLLERHLQDQGAYLRTAVVTAWGTSNMRTGGDDIAQTLALMGVRPQWDAASRRVTGFEVMPVAVLGRPRVDMTLRVSGFFRDAFPGLIDLVDSAARAVMALEESAAENPAAARFREERGAAGDLEAGFRVFGAKPGAYGAGLQALIDERLWSDAGDLADAYLDWGGYAYGRGAEGARAKALFAARLEGTEAVIQNQDNREHDLLDSDDYYQFEGGAAAAVAHLSGAAPTVYHTDHSRPERPVIRTLEEEIGRVVRSRVVNPKWIAGVRRHGYKGAFEIAATVDYMFAFAATTGAVKDRHFDAAFAAYIEDEDVRGFIGEANAPALAEIAERFAEAMDRGLWTPRSNSARGLLDGLRRAR